MDQLINREDYLDTLINLESQNSIKILTGIRRSGKSSLLKLLIDYFKNKGVSEKNLIHLNLNSLKYEDLTYRELYQKVLDQYTGEKLYLFIDEIQLMEDWPKVITSLFDDINCSIYLTGSNSKLLNNDYATRLSGRYVFVEVFPLSFREFIQFKNLVLNESKDYSGTQYLVLDQNSNKQDLRELFNEYVYFGGMPEIVLNDTETNKLKFLESIYLSVFVRDIENYIGLERTSLLERLIRFIASNIGNRISVTKLKNFLTSHGWISSGTHHERIQNLLDATEHAYLFYPISRFNISGKKEMTTLGKYYIADTGLRNHIIDFKSEDRGSILENIVFLELKRRGYKIHTGKLNKSEIDFVINKAGKTSYIQVTESLNNPEVRERELKPLKNLNNAYKRMVLTYEPDLEKHHNGIEIINIIDFLLNPDILE